MKTAAYFKATCAYCATEVKVKVATAEIAERWQAAEEKEATIACPNCECQIAFHGGFTDCRNCGEDMTDKPEGTVCLGCGDTWKGGRL